MSPTAFIRFIVDVATHSFHQIYTEERCHPQLSSDLYCRTFPTIAFIRFTLQDIATNSFHEIYTEGHCHPQLSYNTYWGCFHPQLSSDIYWRTLSPTTFIRFIMDDIPNNSFRKIHTAGHCHPPLSWDLYCRTFPPIAFMRYRYILHNVTTHSSNIYLAFIKNFNHQNGAVLQYLKCIDGTKLALFNFWLKRILKG